MQRSLATDHDTGIPISQRPPTSERALCSCSAPSLSWVYTAVSQHYTYRALLLQCFASHGATPHTQGTFFLEAPPPLMTSKSDVNPRYPSYGGTVAPSRKLSPFRFAHRTHFYHSGRANFNPSVYSTSSSPAHARNRTAPRM